MSSGAISRAMGCVRSAISISVSSSKIARTAGVARAFLSEGLTQNLPIKFFYSGAMFRYERPQKGRQRQFHQIGVELLGAANSWADIECIAMADAILKKLEVRSLSKLEINSIGDAESRFLFLTVYAVRMSALALAGLLEEALTDLSGTIEFGDLAVCEDGADGRLLPTAIFARWRNA